jgi:hypothetical protein
MKIEQATASDRNRMSASEFRKMFGSSVGSATTQPSMKPSIRIPKQTKANKTEERYGHVLACEFKESDGYRIEYEQITLKLSSGVKYTPDWIVWKGSEIVLAVEVKGAFKLGSQGRSVAAFKQAITDFPNVKFRFAQDSKDGWKTVNSKE